jgi:hypothetical protein
VGTPPCHRPLTPSQLWPSPTAADDLFALLHSAGLNEHSYFSYMDKLQRITHLYMDHAFRLVRSGALQLEALGKALKTIFRHGDFKAAHAVKDCYRLIIHTTTVSGVIKS